MVNNGTFIGIDFGTTNTAVVALVKDRYGVKFEKLGENGQYPFPSIIAIPKDKGKDILFGKYVKEHRLELSRQYFIVQSIKSYLGQNYEFIFNGEKYYVVGLVAGFLDYIKRNISKSRGIEITEAVFAVPVDFSSEARRELIEASELVGIKVNGFISESTGAYLSCKENVKAYSNAMVLDWGGGTFDVSILDLKRNRVMEDSVYGCKIGGDDIDLEIAKRTHGRLINKTKIMVSFDDMSPEDKDNIISKCEQAKINLMDDDYVPIVLTSYGEFGTKSIEIDYELFTDILKPMISTSILSTINKALEIARKSKSVIDLVIIVGGSSNLRPFENMITNIFGEDKIYIPEDSQWIVAKGAALVNVLNGKITLNDDLGVVMSDNTVYPILEKNKHGIGSESQKINFSLVEDTTTANFIFTNGDGTQKYKEIVVPSKGFLNERIEVQGKIGIDQIATITIKSTHVGNEKKSEIEINKLKYYYDLSNIAK